MKAGFIELLVDSIGWVLLKALVFAMAILSGAGIGVLSLMAGTALAKGSFGYAGGSEVGIQGGLMYVLAVLPIIAFVFWTGMWFIRSENVEAKHWNILATLQAFMITGIFIMAIPGGIFPKVAAVLITVTLTTALRRGVRRYGKFEANRGQNHLEELLAANVERRAGLEKKFGTVSSSAEDLGIPI